MRLEEKKVLVVGTGKSGIASAELLIKKEIFVTMFDSRTDLKIDEFYHSNPLLNQVPILLGDMDTAQLQEFDVAVISPGVSIELPLIVKMQEMGIEIWGEIELAYYFAQGTLVAITGTNGKTTTTALTGAIMKAFYKDVKVVGNIGIPYTSLADSIAEETVTVAEISSFQLETTNQFHPHVSAILNITPDHLDRHHTMECYAKTKERITLKQTKDDICVLNYDDEVLRTFGKECNANVVYFSSTNKIDEGFYYDDGVIYYVKDKITTTVIHVDEMNLLGKHNYENVMAACAIAVAMNVPMDIIIKVLKEFRAVEHRIEYVTSKRNVKYYNDSKGTNTDAAIQGIRAMRGPTYLIAGGYDKGSEYDEWIEAFEGKVEQLILIGQTAEKIQQCANKHGFYNTHICKDLKEAVLYAYNNAKEGDCVLLSPACASWGMFTNYEERGRVFKEIVCSLKE